MKRTLLAFAIAAIAVPLFASDEHKLIARVNGLEITNADLDEQWNRVPKELQAQYLKTGGKRAFLENYVAKKLLLQDALASGFAEKVDVPDELDEVAAEAALFNRYVRDVVAAPIITEAEMRKVYTGNRAQFTSPEQAHLSIIRMLKNDNPDAAREAMSKVMIEIFSARTTLASQVPPDQLLDALAAKFAEVAKRVSDHESASDGGDLGWVALHTFDPRIAQAGRTMKPGTISGLLESREAFQMILLHEYRPSGVEPYETAQDAIREFLMARDSRKVMQAVTEKTAELRAAGKVEIFAENLR